MNAGFFERADLIVHQGNQRADHYRHASPGAVPPMRLLSALFLKHFPALVTAGHVFVAMPPLFRVDVGKQVFYALDEEEKRSLLDKIEREKIRGQVMPFLKFDGPNAARMAKAGSLNGSS